MTALCMKLLYTLLAIINAQNEERLYHYDCSSQSDWIVDIGSYDLDLGHTYTPIQWRGSAKCPKAAAGDTSTEATNCVHAAYDASISRIISTVGYHSIRLEIDVNADALEAANDDWCIIQYRTSTTSWINRDIVQDSYVLDYSVIIPDNNVYNNQELFEVKIGIAADAGGDNCYFDNLQVFGVRYTEQPTSNPSDSPTLYPSAHPTIYPSDSPTDFPTKYPTNTPTLTPTIMTDNPTNNPTSNPSVYPSVHPTIYPSISPSNKPTQSPTLNPTKATKAPTRDPSTPILEVIVIEETILYPTEYSSILSTFSTETSEDNVKYNGDMMERGVIWYIVIGIVFILIIVVVVIMKKPQSVKIQRKDSIESSKLVVDSKHEQKAPEEIEAIDVPVNKNKNESLCHIVDESVEELMEGEEDIEIESEKMSEGNTSNILQIVSDSRSFEKVTEEGPQSPQAIEMECSTRNDTTTAQFNVADDEFIVDDEDDNIQTMQ